MPVVPATHTFANVLLDSSELNTYVRDVLNFLLAPPVAEMRQTVAQSLTTGVAAAITFDVEDWDPLGEHSTSSNTSRYVAVYPGLRWLHGGVGFVANVTGVRATNWRLNGTDINGSQNLWSASSAFSTMTSARGKAVYMNVGDYVELVAIQTSGGALNTDVATTAQSNFGAKWVSN